jgi:hypothetical protein
MVSSGFRDGGLNPQNTSKAHETEQERHQSRSGGPRLECATDGHPNQEGSGRQREHDNTKAVYLEELFAKGCGRKLKVQENEECHQGNATYWKIKPEKPSEQKSATV